MKGSPFIVTYLGSRHERVPDPKPVGVHAPNLLEAIRKTGPVRDGCEFRVTNEDTGETVTGYIRLKPEWIPQDAPESEPVAA